MFCFPSKIHAILSSKILLVTKLGQELWLCMWLVDYFNAFSLFVCLSCTHSFLVLYLQLILCNVEQQQGRGWFCRAWVLPCLFIAWNDGARNYHSTTCHQNSLWLGFPGMMLSVWFNVGKALMHHLTECSLNKFACGLSETNSESMVITHTECCKCTPNGFFYGSIWR